MTRKAYALKKKDIKDKVRSGLDGRPLSRTTKRECLNCSKMFMSYGPQNRICEYCAGLKGRKNSEENYADPGPYLTFSLDRGSK